MRPYLFKTSDYGKSWTRLDSTLAKDIYLHSVREDPAKRGQLYLGTERGVMYSPDDGKTWKSLRLNLPTVAVHDLVVKGDDLVVGTHGRSVWILDDLQPVRELNETVTKSAVWWNAPAKGTTRLTNEKMPITPQSRKRFTTAGSARPSRARRRSIA